ncbi:MAG TPA: hypothetical protein VNB90_12595 [Cytophagaceae bacterium]|jgi:hypothetical protein|nr:hypothetical protein [Cytophagaceae bacterium]
MKKKKITIKPFLNTYLDPVGTEIEGKKEREIYALYYKVTYDRKNTQLKSYYTTSGYSSLEDPIAQQIVPFELKILTKIVDYETSLNPDREYQLSGLKTKYETYVESVNYTLDKYLRNKLWKATQKTNHLYHHAIRFDNYLGRMNVFTLLEMCDKLFPDFDKYIDKTFREELECFKLYLMIFGDKQYEYDFATLIDWMDGTHQQAFEEGLKKLLKNDVKLIVRNKEIVHRIVIERLKNVVLEP